MVFDQYSEHDSLCSVRISRWAISYMVDESVDADLSQYSNTDQIIEKFCVFLERAIAFRSNSGKSVNVFALVASNWKRFATQLA